MENNILEYQIILVYVYVGLPTKEKSSETTVRSDMSQRIYLTGAEWFTWQKLKNLPDRSWRIWQKLKDLHDRSWRIYPTGTEESTWQELKDLPDRSWRIYLTAVEGSTWQKLKDLPERNWRIYLTEAEGSTWQFLWLLHLHQSHQEHEIYLFYLEPSVNVFPGFLLFYSSPPPRLLQLLPNL